MSIQLASDHNSALPNLKVFSQLVQSANDIYTAYNARVVADGGVVQDAAGCLAAITAALAHGYFYTAAFAFSARWGIKTSGGNITKFYNLVDATHDATVTAGTIGLDTTTAAWATAQWTANATITVAAGLVVNKAGLMGYVGSSIRANAGIGMFLSFTPAAQAWTYNEYSGQMIVNSVNQTNQLSSAYAPASNDSIAYMVDQTTSPNPTFRTWVNGRDKTKQSQAITTLANNATATCTIQRSGAANVNMNEIWLHNGGSASALAMYDAIANCGFDVGARY